MTKRPTPTPLISVVMPVYNAEPFIRDAIQSILGQTFGDYEFLIFDDGSTDQTWSILEQFKEKDRRIQLFRVKENVGYVHHLNRGIEIANGNFIARMDADDIALPYRFARQVQFLNENPRVGVCGGWSADLNNKQEIHRTLPGHEAIKVDLLGHCNLVHPTVMMRKSVLLDHGLRYVQDHLFAEDYSMWVRLSRVTRIANLQEVLLYKRRHRSMVGVVHEEPQLKITRQIKIHQYEELTGRALTPEEMDFVTCVFDKSYFVNGALGAFLQELKETNLRKGVYDNQQLKSFFSNKLIRMINRNRQQLGLPGYLKVLRELRPHVYMDSSTFRQIREKVTAYWRPWPSKLGFPQTGTE